MHDEMRAEIDRKRQPVEEAGVSVLLAFQLFVRFFLRGLEVDVFAVPLPPQRKVVITDDGAEARIGHEQLEHFLALRSFGDQIAHRNNTVVFAELNLLDQLLQLIVAAVNVSHNNCAIRHPTLRCLIQRVLAVYFITDIQSTRATKRHRKYKGRAPAHLGELFGPSKNNWLLKACSPSSIGGIS